MTEKTFFKYLEDNDIGLVLEDPRVSDCRHCYYHYEFTVKDKECPNRERSTIRLNEWSYAIISGMPEKNKVHCLGWRWNTPKFRSKIAVKERPTVAEVEYEPEFVNILPEDNFLSKYCNYANDRTDAYPEFHFLCGLAILSVIVQRKLMMKLKHKPKPFYPNLYGLLIARSTKSRKTTAMDIMKDLVERVVNIYPDEMSFAGLIRKVTEGGQGLFWLDEYGGFLARIKKDFNAGMEEFFSKLYDCPEKYTKSLKKEEFVVLKAYPVILGGVQPSTYAKYTDEENMKSGYTARILCLYPSRYKETKDIDDATFDDDKNKIIIQNDITVYARVFSSIGLPMRVMFTDESKALYNKFSSEFESILDDDIYQEILDPMVGRLKEYVLKLALLFLVGDPEFFKLTRNLNKYVDRRKKMDKNQEEEVTIPENIIKSRIIDRNEKYHNKDILTLPIEYLQYAIFYVKYLFFPHARKMVKKLIEDRKFNQCEYVREIILNNAHITRASLMKRVYHRMKNSKELDEIIEMLEEGKLIYRYSEIKGKRNTTYHMAINSLDDIPRDKDEKRNTNGI